MGDGHKLWVYNTFLYILPLGSDHTLFCRIPFGRTPFLVTYTLSLHTLLVGGTLFGYLYTPSPRQIALKGRLLWRFGFWFLNWKLKSGWQMFFS